MRDQRRHRSLVTLINSKEPSRPLGELFTDQNFIYGLALGWRPPPFLNSPEPEPLQRMVQGCCVLISQVITGSMKTKQSRQMVQSRVE